MPTKRKTSRRCAFHRSHGPAKLTISHCIEVSVISLEEWENICPIVPPCVLAITCTITTTILLFASDAAAGATQYSHLAFKSLTVHHR